MSPRRRLWHYSAGKYPHTYTVEERYPGSVLYEKVWDPHLRKQRRQSLGHRDQAAAMKHADACAALLRDGAKRQPRAAASIGNILRQYLTHRSREKTARVAVEDVRRAGLWVMFLGGGHVRVSEHHGVRTVAIAGPGADRLAYTVGPAEFSQFVAARSAGAIDASGKRVPRRDQVKASPRTVEADLVFLNAVFNWALSWNTPDGAKLLDKNPWGSSAPGVKRALRMPKNDAPARPVASFDRYVALRAAAEKVMMQARADDPEAQRVEKGESHYGKRRSPGPVVVWQKPSYLPDILDLVEDTGRRRGAVVRLWYSDIRWGQVSDGGKPRRGIVSIRWRPFKRASEQVVPVSTRTRAVLERIMRARPGVGDAPLFPSLQDPTRSIRVETADAWLIAAEEIAELPHLKGGRWHPFRRKWATERKHLPDVDVAQIGGWRDLATMKTSYQQADALTMAEVLEAPQRLREREA